MFPLLLLLFWGVALCSDWKLANVFSVLEKIYLPLRYFFFPKFWFFYLVSTQSED